MLKEVILFGLVFSVNVLLGQDSICDTDCLTPIFEINLSKKTEFKKGTRKREYFYIGGELIDFIDYNRKGNVKKVNGRRIKVNSVLQDSLILNQMDHLGKNGLWLDSNLQFSHILREDIILIGIGHYKDDVRTGNWTFYNQNTHCKYAEVNFSGGDIDGTVLLFSKEKVFGEINYLHNCKNGSYKLFYVSGDISETGKFSCGELVKRFSFKKNGEIFDTYNIE